MPADEYGSPTEIIDYYLGIGAYEQIAELTRDHNPQMQKHALEALAKKAPEFARECAQRLICDEMTDSDVRELSEEILGGGKAEELLGYTWSPERELALREEVEKQLKQLEINTRIMIKLKAKNDALKRVLEKLKKEAREKIMTAVEKGDTGRLGIEQYKCVAVLLAHKDISEKFKSGMLPYLPKMVRISTKEQKDVLFSAMRSLAEEGHGRGASEEFARSVLLVMGQMLHEINKMRKEAGGLPEKDKIFHRPKSGNPPAPGKMKARIM